jgi:hypothetical protein
VANDVGAVVLTSSMHMPALVSPLSMVDASAAEDDGAVGIIISPEFKAQECRRRALTRCPHPRMPLTQCSDLYETERLLVKLRPHSVYRVSRAARTFVVRRRQPNGRDRSSNGACAAHDDLDVRRVSTLHVRGARDDVASHTLRLCRRQPVLVGDPALSTDEDLPGSLTDVAHHGGVGVTGWCTASHPPGACL